MSDELKPCPLCGGEMVTEKSAWECRYPYYVTCPRCDLYHGLDLSHWAGEYATEAQAVKSWNDLAKTRGSVSTMSEKHADGMYPRPCTNVKEKNVKEWFAKIDEELNEFKAAVLAVDGTDEGYRNLTNDIAEINMFMHDYQAKQLAEEAADTITAITSMLEALGIDEEMRQEAQKQVNAKNKERGRFWWFFTFFELFAP